MTILEAYQLFKTKYLSEHFEIVGENIDRFEFGLRHPLLNNTTVNIKQKEILEYIEIEPKFDSLKRIPVECSIATVDYREQLVDFVDGFQRRILHNRERKYVIGDMLGVHVEISPASSLFCHYFRFDESYLQIAFIRGRNRIVHLDSEENDFHSDLYYKPLTIKIFGINETTPEIFVKKTNQLVDTCFFELAYLKNVNMAVVEDWPKKVYPIRQFEFGEQFTGNEIPLPRILLNSEVVKFYQRGLGTGDPAYKFLSFYQVLEYYFLDVSDENLYIKLGRRISDPKFSVDAKNLDKVIQDIIEYKRETDETEMLKMVLLKYLDTKELIEYIEAYEKYLQVQLYTKKREIFGVESEIKLDPTHVIGNIAKRIKNVRNSLVHSSDRYERKERYLPTSKSEETLKKELPLLKYIVEKVIIGSAIK